MEAPVQIIQNRKHAHPSFGFSQYIFLLSTKQLHRILKSRCSLDIMAEVFKGSNGLRSKQSPEERGDLWEVVVL